MYIPVLWLWSLVLFSSDILYSTVQKATGYFPGINETEIPGVWVFMIQQPTLERQSLCNISKLTSLTKELGSLHQNSSFLL